MAQSSLSQSLQSMEAELGGKLFIRTSTGVRPTQAGEIMLERARKMLVDYRQVRDIIQDMEELKAGQVEFGISTFRGSYLLPGALRSFKRLYPQIHVENHGGQQHGPGTAADRGAAGSGACGAAADQAEIRRASAHEGRAGDHGGGGPPVLECARETVRNGEDRTLRGAGGHMQFDYILSDYDTIMAPWRGGSSPGAG